MKNLSLPQSEVELVKECISTVNKIIENHSKVQPDILKAGATSFNRVHTMMYLDFLHDFIESAKGLEHILDMDSETLEKRLADDGTTMEEFEKKLMTKMLMDLFVK